jgi:membrane protease YdiL (CAAX protease family)
MTNSDSRAKAIIEVLAVFVLVFLILWAIRISPLWKWQRTYLKHEFMNHTTMIALSLIMISLTRRSFTAYGLSFKNLRYHLTIALICILPVMLVSSAFARVDWTSRNGALILAALYLALLFVLAWLLRKRPTVDTTTTTALFAVLLLSAGPLSMEGAVIRKILGTIYYFFFVGFGEEMLFRGYIQSRLNAAFGRAYRFFGVKWGWGLIITSLLFGFAHVFNHFNPFLKEFNLMWWWAFWNIFTGLVFGYLREKTSSILVPAILHGFPLTIAFLFFGL